MAGLRRGDVHMARLGRRDGRAQAGTRPVVVLQAPGLLNWSTVVIAPLSASVRASSFRPKVLLKGTETRVLADQLRAADVQRVGKRMGHLSTDEMIAVDVAVKQVLGLR